jgi:hypothetical protein
MSPLSAVVPGPAGTTALARCRPYRLRAAGTWIAGIRIAPVAHLTEQGWASSLDGQRARMRSKKALPRADSRRIRRKCVCGFSSFPLDRRVCEPTAGQGCLTLAA